MDSDDDEIVVNGQEDLLEAYHHLFMNKFIKFFVYYNGNGTLNFPFNKFFIGQEIG